MPVGLQPSEQTISPCTRLRACGQAQPLPMPVLCAASRAITFSVMPPSTPRSGMASMRVARYSRARSLWLSGSSIRRPSWRASRMHFMEITRSVDAELVEVPDLHGMGEHGVKEDEDEHEGPEAG